MTPKILPKAPASAAAASRARPAPDASADPFALHLENAAEHAANARGKDKPASDLHKVDANVRPVSAKPRKDAVKRKTTDRPDAKPAAKPDSSEADAAPESDHDAQATDADSEFDDAHTSASAAADSAPNSENTAISAEAMQNAALAAQQIQIKQAPEPAPEAQADPAAEASIQLVQDPARQAQPALPENPATEENDSAPKAVTDKHARPQAKQASEQEPQLANQDGGEKEPAQNSAGDASPDDAEKADVPLRAPRPLRPRAGQLAEKSHADKESPADDAPATASQATAAATPATADISAALTEKPSLDASKDDTAAAPRPASPLLSVAHSQNNSPAAHGAELTRAAQDSPRTGPENTFDQIVLGLRTKMDAANQKAQIELNPPNLGKLQVSIEVSNGLLTAQFRAGSDVVRDLLSSRMDHLRSVLEGQGIAVDKLAVSSAPSPGDTGSSAGNLAGQNHEGRSGGAFSNERHASRQSSSDAFGKFWRAAREKEEPIDLLA